MSLKRDLSFERRKGTSGMGGQLYEIQLCMLLMMQGTENKKIIDFLLASNMKEAGDFDDAVFRYYYKDDNDLERSKTIFLQSKHKEPEKKEEEGVDELDGRTTIEANRKKITINSLLSSSRTGHFVLRKYLSSFSKIKCLFSQSRNHPIFSGSIEDCEFVIYTNAPFHNEFCHKHAIKSIVESEHILNIDQKGNNYYYQIRACEKVMDALKSSLDYEMLIEELTKTILNKSLDMNKPILNDYHFPLKEKVIKIIGKREGMFRNDFIENNEDFLNSIFKEINNKVETVKSVEDLKTLLETLLIQIPEKFEKVKNYCARDALPKKEYNEEEINEFLSKLKLFVSQPNERELGKFLKNKFKSIYDMEHHVNAVLSEVEKRTQNWWRRKNITNYLTKDNNILQESTKNWFGCWFNVRPPTELFTGREQEVIDLHEKINQSQEKVTIISQMISIGGLGGIGKTELARKYIDSYANNYHNNIIWMNAESKDTLTEGFVRLAEEKLNINTYGIDGKKKSVEWIIEAIYGFFSKRKCLFIFDNALNCEDCTQFLPLKYLKPYDQKPYILMTSRDRQWGPGIEVLDLFVLNLNDAINLVKRGLNNQFDDHDDDIKKLVIKLQCFTLAIRQAIGYIQNKMVTEKYTISNYLIDFEKKSEELLKSYTFQSVIDDYVKTTFTTWNITIQKIKNEINGDLALEILSIMAFIAPDNIKRSMFLCLHKDKHKVESAVRLLVQYSMINGEQYQSLLNIHRLVQEVIRIEIKYKKEEEKFIKITYSILKCISSQSEEMEINLLSHLETFLIHLENCASQNQSRFMSLFSRDAWFTEKTQLKLMYEDAVRILEAKNFNHPNKIAVLEKKLEYYKKYNPSDISELSVIILRLTNCYENISNYQKQAELLEEALVLFDKFYDVEKKILTLIDLSEAYKILGNDMKTKECLNRILELMGQLSREEYLYNKYIKFRYLDLGENLEELLEFKEVLERDQSESSLVNFKVNWDLVDICNIIKTKSILIQEVLK